MHIYLCMYESTHNSIDNNDEDSLATPIACSHKHTYAHIHA